VHDHFYVILLFFYIFNGNFHEEDFGLARALTGKVSIPLAPLHWVRRLTFTGSLTVLLSEVVGFALEEPTSLMLEELEAGLLEAGKDRLKLGLLVVVVLELSLKSVR